MDDRYSQGIELADLSSLPEPISNASEESEDDGLMGEDSSSTFQVIGMNTQILHVQLEPNDQVKFEPGMMMHMDPHVTPVTNFNCNASRCVGGESQSETQLQNHTAVSRVVGLTSNTPGAKIIPVALTTLGGGCIACEAPGSPLSAARASRLTWTAASSRAALGGRASGGNSLGSTVFLCGGGTVLRREMARHERVVLDDHCLLAWTGSVTFASRAAFDGCADLCCGCSGEGAFNFVVYGGDEGGVIYIQSMPFKKFRAAVARLDGGANSKQNKKREMPHATWARTSHNLTLTTTSMSPG
eukprot:CAMPEP_0171773048 /NCGR_PEP_ID=MMETSP0991-20121206/55068_1 /TAXON_ID=483369 /ORGANISM="non described non described, Strain CCMP2098" /LENGTH=299 /DNA_ID=CAMNT_0012378725 /DNA_START=213 /DNA_END=1110 /DNA_ORIENTATION=-